MNEPEIEIDSPYAVCCPFCGKPYPEGCPDPMQCVSRAATEERTSDAQTIADLRAEIARQAETIAAFERVVEMRDQRIAELLAELEGRAKGSEE